VPDGDAAAMAAAVIRILDDPELAQRLSRGGRALAARSDWKCVRPQWDGLLAALATAG
jgi:glycosyltransferase involved in cell wall biosynthesis